MDQPTLPLPPPPEFPPKPRGSCLVYLTVLFGFFGAVLLTFLMFGYFLPFVVGFAMLSIIALQYLIWGWWFERIYRDGVQDRPTSVENLNQLPTSSDRRE